MALVLSATWQARAFPAPRHAATAVRHRFSSRVRFPARSAALVAVEGLAP